MARTARMRMRDGRPGLNECAARRSGSARSAAVEAVRFRLRRACRARAGASGARPVAEVRRDVERLVQELDAQVRVSALIGNRLA